MNRSNKKHDTITASRYTKQSGGIFERKKKTVPRMMLALVVCQYQYQFLKLIKIYHD